MDDLISRQAAIDTINELHDKPNAWLDLAVDALENMPSAQPTEASCWGCNCPKMEMNEQKTFSEMVHLHDAETHEKRTETHACDLIDRQAAIDAIKTWGLIDGLAEGQAIEILSDEEKLPSAQPERKTWRWIHDGYAFKGGVDWMHCSECGHKDSWSAATRTPFCAWCGAKMEGTE